jgi:hypothetical protein
VRFCSPRQLDGGIAAAQCRETTSPLAEFLLSLGCRLDKETVSRGSLAKASFETPWPLHHPHPSIADLKPSQQALRATATASCRLFPVRFCSYLSQPMRVPAPMCLQFSPITVCAHFSSLCMRCCRIILSLTDLTVFKSLLDC